MFNGLINYCKTSFEEMKKVSWPTKKETKNYSLLVIGISISMMIILASLDYLFVFLWGLIRK